MILWAMLVLGIIGFIASMFSIRQFDKLNEQLDRNARNVEYFEYLLIGLCAILLPVGSLSLIIVSVLCLLA